MKMSSPSTDSFWWLPLTAPHVNGRCLLVCLDVAEILAVEVLRKKILSSLVLRLDCNASKGFRPENFF
jgi:hypothetical protein